jgi:hypothetical protein
MEIFSSRASDDLSIVADGSLSILNIGPETICGTQKVKKSDEAFIMEAL